MRKLMLSALCIIVILAISPTVALGDGALQANATASSTSFAEPQSKLSPNPASPASIAVIETGLDIEDSVGKALTELGYAYDFYDHTFPPNYNVYDVIIQGMDGGTVTQIPQLAAFINAGGHAIILGGSRYEPFVLDVDAHLLDVDETNYEWTQVAGTPDITIVNKMHPLSCGLPLTYDFVDSRATYYMLRIVESVVLVATNGDGYKAIISKALGSGKFTWFINSPYEYYWLNAGDYSYLKTYLSNALAWCIDEGWYVLRLNPFIDVLHLKANPGGWLNGYCETPSYSVPVLGKSEAGKAFIVCDLPPGGIEMSFIVITVATRDGYMYRIYDDLSLIGPTYVWLTPVAEQSGQKLALDDAVDSQVTPQAWYSFRTNPYIDIVHLNTDLRPWLWGWADPYPAPVLGYVTGGKFYFAMDYPDLTPGSFELSFWAGTAKTRDGYFTRTTCGMTYVGPDYFWLTPV